MSRVIPQFKDIVSRPPEWLDTQKLVQASVEEVQQRKQALEKLSSHQAPTAVAFYACTTCKTRISADASALKSQANLAARANKEPEYICPDCSTPLIPYDTIKVSEIKRDSRFADQAIVRKDVIRKEGGTYNTFIDRHLVFRAVNELERFASKNGMTLARARFLRAERSKLAGQEYPILNDIVCELAWKFGRQYELKATASIAIDVAGKFVFPKVFTTSDGKQHPFEKVAVRNLEKEFEFEHFPKTVERKSDQPTYRKPDITRFHAVASQKQSDDDAIVNELVESSKKKVVANPAPAIPSSPTPGTQPAMFSPGQSVVNPLDGKQYTVKQSDSPAGMVLTDPITQQDVVVPKDQTSNIKPVVQTASLSAEAVADELIREHLREDLQTEEQEIEQHLDMINTDVGEIVDDQMLLNTMVANRASTKQTERVKHMARNWKQIRENIHIPSRKAVSAVSEDIPIEKMTRQQRAAADLGYSPTKPDKDRTGHDKKTGLPFTEDKPITVGLTEFPKDQDRDKSSGPPLSSTDGYRIPFEEMDDKQVKEREYFRNQDKLPLDGMKREELVQYVKEGNPERNYGLSNLEAEAMLDAVGFNKTSAAGLQLRSAESAEEETPLKPIEHRELKTAPKIEEFKEPEVIPPAEGKLKEAITKFRNTQKDIAAAKAHLEELLRPFQESIKQIQEGPSGVEIQKLQSTLKKYLEMVYRELGETEERVAAYEDSIFARFERQIERGPQVTLTELLAEVERVMPEIAEKVNQLKTALQDRKNKEVLERILFEYPVSRTQQKKITSAIENSADSIIQMLVEWIDSMRSLNARLAETVVGE